MVEQIPAEEALAVVGYKRHPHSHLGYADSTKQVMTILHSQSCVVATPDLRTCMFSYALNNGINRAAWRGMENKAVRLHAVNGQLLPDPLPHDAEKIDE